VDEAPGAIEGRRKRARMTERSTPTANGAAMTFRHTTEFTVEFGDCDPAGIVYYPNFFRWMDAAARHFFAAAGVPPWRELEARTGIVGTPVIDASARFVRPASYGERIAIDTTIAEWRGTRMVLKHVVRRGEQVLVEGEEVRVFARRHPEDPARIQAVPPPQSARALLDTMPPDDDEPGI
jgi:4-hydroxybenzoyl-CoA thioesterase